MPSSAFSLSTLWRNAFPFTLWPTTSTGISIVTLRLLRATGYVDGPFRVEPVSSARGGSELCSVTDFATSALHSSPGTVRRLTRVPCQILKSPRVLLHVHTATFVAQESIANQNGRP
jgi:hypothetical protein